MHPDPFINEESHEKLLNNCSNYKLGFHMGLAHVTDNSWYIDKIDDLEQLLVLNKDCVKRLNDKIKRLECELETPWYRKLLNKLPSFKIEWKERYHEQI